METEQCTQHKLEQFTSRQLLAIPDDQPERLFSRDEACAKTEYRALCKTWHPDLNHDALAKKVFEHVHILYRCAKEKTAAGTWEVPGELRLTAIDGHGYNLKFIKKHAFELGAMYISRGLVTFVIEHSLGADLALNGVDQLKGIVFADEKLRKEFSSKIPELVKSFETATQTVCVFKKDPAMVLLADLRDFVLASTGKPLISKHVAWVVSRLLGLACFAQMNDLTHNAISCDTVFVSPEMHTAALIGGWWYAAKEATLLKGLPGTALDHISPRLLASGRASRKVDLELIRAAGRDLLGDPTGSSILRNPDVPKAMARWLTGTTSGDAFKDFHVWSEDVLKSSFGARRFTVLDVSFSDVYQPI